MALSGPAMLNSWTLFLRLSFFFFFNDTATTEIYTLSLHDALPIWLDCPQLYCIIVVHDGEHCAIGTEPIICNRTRSEEHTSELQSRQYLVCRLLLEKKKTA